MSMAQGIFDKIKQLNAANDDVNSKLGGDRTSLSNKMDEYENVYSKLLATQKIKDTTVDAQLEDIKYKEKSQSLRLAIWGCLAGLVVLLTIDQMKK